MFFYFSKIFLRLLVEKLYSKFRFSELLYFHITIIIYYSTSYYFYKKKSLIYYVFTLYIVVIIILQYFYLSLLWEKQVTIFYVNKISFFIYICFLSILLLLYTDIYNSEILHRTHIIYIIHFLLFYKHFYKNTDRRI